MNFSQPKLNLSDIKEKYNGWSDWTTWNVALWINNDECYYNIAKECRNYADFLYEMQAMIGSFATPDGADWGEANIDEMNEVIMEAIKHKSTDPARGLFFAYFIKKIRQGGVELFRLRRYPPPLIPLL